MGRRVCAECGGGDDLCFNFFVCFNKVQRKENSLTLGKRLALPTTCQALEIQQQMESPQILFILRLVSFHVSVVKLRGKKPWNEKWHCIFKPNCIIMLILIWVASSGGGLLRNLWCCLLCSVFRVCEDPKPGSCEQNILVRKASWKLMARQLQLHRFSLANKFV